jgi:hypothetical protein
MQEEALTVEQQSDIEAHIDQNLGPESAAIFMEVFKEILVILDEVEGSLIYVESLALASTAVSIHLSTMKRRTNPCSSTKNRYTISSRLEKH